MMSRPLFLAVPAYERLGTSCNSVFCKPRLYQVAISAPRPRRDHFHREARPRIAVSYPTEGNSQELVYFATFPLIGLESLEGAINFAGGELPEFMAQHCAVIVERPSEGMCMIFDFLPKEPTAPGTAASLLRGSSVPGIARQRQMRRVPRRRCTRLGVSPIQNAMRAGMEFNAAWDTKLRLYQNDCRHHSQQLARLLMNDPQLKVL